MGPPRNSQKVIIKGRVWANAEEEAGFNQVG